MTRQRALRTAAWLAALAVIALPLVAAKNGWLASDRWPFRQLSVSGAFEHVSIDEVRALAAPALKPGYFAVDLEHVRRNVSTLTWVEHVEVRKRWPDQLDIEVIERKAIARWGSDRLLSAQGELFRAEVGAWADGLPQFHGPDEHRLQVRDFYLQAQQALAPTGIAATGALLSGRGAWTLDLSNGGQLVLGREQAAERLQRFAAVFLKLTAADPARLQRADLRYENGFALTWAPASAEAPIAPPPVDTAPPAATTPEAVPNAMPIASPNEPART